MVRVRDRRHVPRDRFVDQGTDGGELRLQLAPMPAMHLRVVDASGKPVRGAWARITSFGFGSSARDARGQAKERIATRFAMYGNGAGSSDAGGRLVVPVQDWRPMDLDDARLRVHAGTLQSEPLRLATGDEDFTAADLGRRVRRARKGHGPRAGPRRIEQQRVLDIVRP